VDGLIYSHTSVRYRLPSTFYSSGNRDTEMPCDLPKVTTGKEKIQNSPMWSRAHTFNQQITSLRKHCGSYVLTAGPLHGMTSSDIIYISAHVNGCPGVVQGTTCMRWPTNDFKRTFILHIECLNNYEVV
jgi:hypothetical protein